MTLKETMKRRHEIMGLLSGELSTTEREARTQESYKLMGEALTLSAQERAEGKEWSSEAVEAVQIVAQWVSMSVLKKMHRVGAYRLETVERLQREAMNGDGDGAELAQVAFVAILEGMDRAQEQGQSYTLDMETEAQARRHVVRGLEEPEGKTVTITEGQRLFKAVRRHVESMRAVLAEGKGEYLELSEDLYLSVGMYEAVGTSGNGERSELEEEEHKRGLLEALKLTDRQSSILRLRLRGYSVRAIADYLGLKSTGTVTSALEAIQSKALELDELKSAHELQTVREEREEKKRREAEERAEKTRGDLQTVKAQLEEVEAQRQTVAQLSEARAEALKAKQERQTFDTITAYTEARKAYKREALRLSRMEERAEALRASLVALTVDTSEDERKRQSAERMEHRTGAQVQRRRPRALSLEVSAEAVRLALGLYYGRLIDSDPREVVTVALARLTGRGLRKATNRDEVQRRRLRTVKDSAEYLEVEALARRLAHTLDTVPECPSVLSEAVQYVLDTYTETETAKHSAVLFSCSHMYTYSKASYTGAEAVQRYRDTVKRYTERAEAVQTARA